MRPETESVGLGRECCVMTLVSEDCIPFKMRVWIPALSFPSHVTLGMNVLELLCASGSSLV